MITLNDSEKRFLQSIVDLAGKKPNEVYFANLVNEHLVNVSLYLDYRTGNVKYFFDSEVYVPNSVATYEKIIKLTWDLVSFVKLIQYFEQQNYLYLYLETEVPEHPSFGAEAVCDYFIESIKDRDVTKLILGYSYKTIIIGQTFIDYVKNEFKTQEQLQHEENVKIAEDNLRIANESLKKSDAGLEQAKRSVSRSTVAIWVSIALGIISIWSSFYISNQQAKNDTEINPKQFEELQKKIVLIEKTIASIDSNLQKFKMPDTVNALIVRRNTNDKAGKAQKKIINTNQPAAN